MQRVKVEVEPTRSALATAMHVKFKNNTSGRQRLWDTALKFLYPGLFITSPDHLARMDGWLWETLFQPWIRNFQKYDEWWWTSSSGGNTEYKRDKWTRRQQWEQRTRRLYFGTKVNQYSQENEVWHKSSEAVLFHNRRNKRTRSYNCKGTRQTTFKIFLKILQKKMEKSTNRVHSRRFKEASSATFLRGSYLSISLNMLKITSFPAAVRSSQQNERASFNVVSAASQTLLGN